jgi:hypothetical protein
MEVGVQHRIPETERLPESNRPRLGCVDLDPGAPNHRLSQSSNFEHQDSSILIAAAVHHWESASHTKATIPRRRATK